MTLEIVCEEKWWAAQKEAEAHNDLTLNKCVTRLLSWMHEQSNIKRIVISSDFGKHCFFFSTYYADGNTGICGGIVFHGFPEEGYVSNGSIQIEPDYGWHIHT